ncbi:hypothetical protein [uncultured Paracoccus sp.]|uniref:hypothetical protein n=1 Tax=uncultured Paracoccus sp. TaxID=189685 RepID=UPI0026346B93|nr:hypothetical protein [uncultured Paracoccus sp.]
MLAVLRDEQQEHEERMKAAISAAPYVHPRLNAVNHSGQVNITHEEALLALGSIDDAMSELDADTDENHSGVTH